MGLLIVGTIAFDSLETPHGNANRVVGGSCQYSSYAASYFTNDIRMVSIIGDDFPDSELQTLVDKGASIEGVKIVEGGKSFYWAGRYLDNMNDRVTLTTDLNVLADFDPVLPDNYKSSEYILLGNLTPDIQISVINQLTHKPKLVVLDTMNFWIENTYDKLLEAIKLCDVLTINDEEARMLSGEHSLVKAAGKIFNLGPKYLIIKKGEHGCLLFDKNNVFFAPALPLAEVKDPTGAGDCFAGGFLGYIAKTGDTSFDNLKRAIIYGSAAASFVVEDFSNYKIKDLSQTEFDQRVDEFVKLSQFSL